MKGIFKKITTFSLAAITAITVGLSASASGTLNQTYGMNNSTPYYLCSYNVDGNLNLSGHGQNAGAMENNSFYVTNNGTYQLDFTPSTNCATTLKIWKAGDFPSGSPVYTLSIPKASSGMPSSFHSSLTLETGYYDVEVISAQLGTYSKGDFTIYGVLEKRQG